MEVHTTATLILPVIIPINGLNVSQYNCVLEILISILYTKAELKNITNG